MDLPDDAGAHRFVCQSCNTVLTFEGADKVSLPASISGANASTSGRVTEDTFVDLGETPLSAHVETSWGKGLQ